MYKSFPPHDPPDLAIPKKRQSSWFFVCIVASLLFLTVCKSKEQVSIFVDLLNPIEDAELFWDTRYIDVGAPLFHGALLGGWNRDRRESGGITYAKATSKNSYITFYVFEPSDRNLEVKCKGVSAHQTLFLSVNGNSLDPRQIDTSYQMYSFPVSKSFLRAGKNFMEVYSLLPDRTRSAVIIDEISFRKSGESQKDESGFRRIFQTSPEEPSARSAIRAAVPSAIVDYFLVPESASLNVEYQLPRKMSSPTATQIEIHIKDQQRRHRLLSSNILRNGLFGSHWRKESISLKDYENRIVELKLQALPVPGTAVPEYIDWTRVSFKMNSPSSERLKNEPGPGDLMQKPANIIIYVTHSLREDHLQPYGYPYPTSPFLAEFAKDSVVFENAYSQAPWIRPSVASIFTGLLPSSHGTEGRHDLFPEETPTIASELKSQGFTTFGFVTSIHISNKFGFGKDFDHYYSYAGEGSKEGVYVSSDKLHEHLRNFLRQGLRNRTFLYIHAMDPGEPYRAGAESGALPASCKKDLADVYSNTKNLYAKECDAELAECLKVFYDGEVRKSDYYFGQFLKRLKELGMYERSLIIFTADHGQSFCEHRNLQHGGSLYQSEIRVPLIVKFPGKKFAGKEIQALSRHTDLFPTILESAGAEIPESLEGNSLFDLLDKRSAKEFPVFAEFNLEGLRKRAFVFEKWKFIENRDKFEYDTGRFELYDISKDSGEKSDLSTRDPILFGYIRKTCRQFSRIYFKAHPETIRKEAAIDKDTEEALKVQGYLQ